MILGIIPARYASTRFPGKPLASILGKSMIQRVYEQAMSASSLDKVVVATDDERIAEHVLSFNGNVVYTSPGHPSGTDRCHEALLKTSGSFDYVINIQGDEPFIHPTQIDILAALCDGETELATLMIRVSDPAVLHDPGEVKIVMNDKKEAIYFSRSVIPFIKSIPPHEWVNHFNYYRHVGMYAYRNDVLEKITRLGPSYLERAESLEQLRWIENGYRIKLGITTHDSHCVDTPEDIPKVLKLMGLEED